MAFRIDETEEGRGVTASIFLASLADALSTWSPEESSSSISITDSPPPLSVAMKGDPPSAR